MKVVPQAADDPAAGPFSRLFLDKKFTGDLDGVSKGQMVGAGTAVEGSAAYVAIEVVKASWTAITARSSSTQRHDAEWRGEHAGNGRSRFGNRRPRWPQRKDDHHHRRQTGDPTISNTLWTGRRNRTSRLLVVDW